MTELKFATTFNTDLRMMMIVSKELVEKACVKLQNVDEKVLRIERLIQRTDEDCIIENI